MVILHFLSPNSAVYNWERFQIKSGLYVMARVRYLFSYLLLRKSQLTKIKDTIFFFRITEQIFFSLYICNHWPLSHLTLSPALTQTDRNFEDWICPSSCRKEVLKLVISFGSNALHFYVVVFAFYWVLRNISDLGFLQHLQRSKTILEK